MGLGKRLYTRHITANRLDRRLARGLRGLGKGDGFHVDFSMFFDRTHVINRVEKKQHRVLSGTGAYAMGAMRKSMRKGRVSQRNKPGPPHYGGGSKPGEPPRWWSKLLRDFIFFGFDADKESVLVGPYKFTRKQATSVTVPKLLNDGGAALTVLPGGRAVMASYLPRPFATPESPAGQAGTKKFHELTEKIPL